MYEFTGELRPHINYTREGRPIITIVLDDKVCPHYMADELKGSKLSIKIGKFKQKRSLDANAYCWTLIGKIAGKTGVPKEEVYREAIRAVGSYEIVCVKAEAAESLRKGWEHNGLGWQTDEMLSKLDGCTNVVLYYGSSTYDAEQMGRLIENILQDCKALGIETKSSEEIDSLIKSWGGSK